MAGVSCFGSHQEPVKQQHLHSFVYSGKQSYVSTGLLFITPVAEGTTGEETNTIPKHSHGTPLNCLCFSNMESCFPWQMLSSDRVLKTTPRSKCPARKFSRGKPLGLKCWELLGAFLYGFLISYLFCSSFSFPLPYHSLHLPFPLIASVQIHARLRLPFVTSPDTLSSFPHSGLPTLTLISLLPATRTAPPRENCSFTFSCSTSSRVNKIAIKQMVRAARKHSSRDFKESLWLSCSHFLW